jgi:hypothetical protein
MGGTTSVPGTSNPKKEACNEGGIRHRPPGSSARHPQPELRLVKNRVVELEKNR